MKKYAIIVAGGSGTRFGSTLPKQFIPLGGVPVLMRTIKAFADYDRDINIVVALPSEHLTLWGDLCASRNFDVPHKVVEGGANRFESVRNALFAINETECLVAVHDGARPLVTVRVMEEAIAAAAQYGAAAPAIPVHDTIKVAQNGIVTQTPDRSTLFAVQTPQVFRTEAIRTALRAALEKNLPLTDDCSAMEAAGYPVHLTAGEEENLKITVPSDLILAEAILKRRENP